MKENKKKRMTYVAVASTLTVAGFIVMPRLIKKYGNKIYKESLEKEKINFDDMGPEVIPFDNEKQEEK